MRRVSRTPEQPVLSNSRCGAGNVSRTGLTDFRERDPPQLMGRTALDPRWHAIHEDGSPFPGETFPVMVTLHTGAPRSNVVMGVYKPTGELTWISINSQPQFDVDGTTLAGVVASFADITDRKRLEERLNEASIELARFRETT